MNVTIRLFIPLATFHWDPDIMPYRAGVCLRGNLLSDLTYLVGLDSEFNELIRRHPRVNGWHVDAYVTSSSPPKGHMDASSLPRETRIPTPLSHFERLLPFLNQMLELFGDTRAETLGGQTQIIRDGPVWVARMGRKGIGTIKLPRGLQLSIDSSV
jgi:hypothetical protein